MYDETPMPVRLRDKIEEIQHIDLLSNMFSSSSSWDWTTGAVHFSESGPAKLFQVESAWGALISIEYQ
eukprot:4877269-Pyramimonas_sp.AAC.1